MSLLRDIGWNIISSSIMNLRLNNSSYGQFLKELKILTEILLGSIVDVVTPLAISS